ncbi:AraC family transcriptional regulator [Dyadobacter sp. CY356]|uniref:helix-turn-helix domain-containing protein n=1 Tax=Dyadobacter sp. CY356 TaxID=2906442 RepID=UPI001F3F1404|nr:helix-turn-helix transcriptional regulator [Dyadobacter sp. CY356]MCF0055887.1 AraC family transcriptional regulator [Dyadobacter sp. CY356]
MKNSFNKSTDLLNETRQVKITDFPLHQLGGDFFMMSKIEESNEHYFNGIHRHDFYEFLWFTDVKPRQVHFIDFIKYPISRNQLFLLLPDQVHNIDKRDKVGYLFAISKDFFERLIAGDIFKLFYHTVNFSIIVPDSQVCLFHKLIDLIQLEHDGEKRPAILESYLRSWFLHCIEFQKDIRKDENKDNRMNLLIESVENHFKSQRSAAFYANELSLSAKRLNELTKDTYGKTINQIINERLILEAKREISCFDKSIKEISYELGFSEPAYFTRFFGKQTGHTPEDFRKKTGDVIR